MPCSAYGLLMPAKDLLCITYGVLSSQHASDEGLMHHSQMCVLS